MMRLSPELAERWRQIPIRLSCVAVGAVGALEGLRLAEPAVLQLSVYRPILLGAVALAVAAGLFGSLLRHARRS